MSPRRDERELRRFNVCRTANRDFSKEYIAQLNGRALEEEFPGTEPGDFILVRNTVTVPEEFRTERLDVPDVPAGDTPETVTTELHMPVFVNDDIRYDSDRDVVGDIGLDFAVRTALGAPSELDLDYGEGAESEPSSKPHPFPIPKPNA